MRQALMMWVVLPAVMLLASGCVATRGWVREHVDKTEVAMDKKVSAVDQKSAAESQRLDQKVDGVDGRLKTTEGNLAETTATAKGAKERADSAYTKADETNSRLTRLWTNRNNRKEADSYQILFGFDKWEIGDAGQTKLSELVREMNRRATVYEAVSTSSPNVERLSSRGSRNGFWPGSWNVTPSYGVAAGSGGAGWPTATGVG